ncbi:uncharacterized protein PgNI_02182 [Pyricularia grisea]|uniref:Squalene cyclase C-terminal domain-containing protein n=1 Tax=Pyricularia grisea TaxID=148305 RepID=A0A6P8BFX3_PYRGI|nr:uncharacterized protein PgNI_02182 [Pyricularia grisea]TLD15615.1 hypothetical protein PgNI_02182 [Pyricularia grisea]
MVRALVDAGIHQDEELLTRPVDWLLNQQITDREIGDWRVYRPTVCAGGFAFEYNNKWYPDVDDTAVGAVALLHHDPSLANHASVSSAAAWILGMQNKNGGWAAFDADNDAFYLNDLPFADMDSLCDPSTPDVVGHVLEFFGLLFQLAREYKIKNPDMVKLLPKARASCTRSIAYLARTQEEFGSWYGRWGINYLFGTSAVLSGLAYFVDGDSRVPDMCAAGVKWLSVRQNQDGGWGETTESYKDKRLAGVGKSAPSQTAWALMGLLGFLNIKDAIIEKGVAPAGGVAGTWPEEQYTATGFPGQFYLKYQLYSHYFPMMALGRYRSLTGVD